MKPDLDALIRKEFGLGAKETPEKIYHCMDPRLPQFGFEWHTGNQKVYRIDVPGKWISNQWVMGGVQANGLCIAEHCLTHGQFLGVVQTFCRGYLLAVAHQHQGQLCTYAPMRIKEGDPCPTR